MRKSETAKLSSWARLRVGRVRRFCWPQEWRASERRRVCHFDVLLTVDRGLEYEQNLAGRRIAVVIFRTKSIALQELLPHVPACLTVLASIKPGEIAKVPETRTSR